jgi:ribosomal protein S18 acetylase RimI-like enzyme
MELRRIQASELSSVHELLCANGWRERIGSVQQFGSLVEASQVADVAVIEGRVVGFVRAITDGQSNGYLSMLVVASAHRGRGIGRRLVERAMGANTRVTWVLRAGREGAAEFFAKLGFEHSSLAMERRRV